MVVKINKVFSLLIFLSFFALLIFSSIVANGVKTGINLSLNILIPSLLPFTVLSIMFLKSGGFYYLSKIIGAKFSIWLISAIGGYMSGAIVLKNLEENTPKPFLKNACLYAVNAGPSFIFFAVGIATFNNLEIALYLLFSHLAASFIFCVFSKGIDKNLIKKPASLTAGETLFISLEQGLINILKICGMVVFISAIYEIIKIIEPLKFLSLFLEVTVGISKSNKNLYLIQFLLSFSGLSVILQIKMILKNTISFLRCFLYRVLHGTISLIILTILNYFAPISVQTISNNITFHSKISYVSISSSIALIFMCIIFMVQLLRRKNNRENSRLEFNYWFFKVYIFRHICF